MKADWGRVILVGDESDGRSAAWRSERFVAGCIRRELGHAKLRAHAELAGDYRKVASEG